jgi:hypothetical protein
MTGDGHATDRSGPQTWRSQWMVCVKECASFLRLCSSGYGPLANPVALRSEGADNPNIIQTCGRCFPDTVFWIQSAPPLKGEDFFLYREFYFCLSHFLSVSFSLSLFLSLCFCLPPYIFINYILVPIIFVRYISPTFCVCMYIYIYLTNILKTCSVCIQVLS